MKLENLVNQYKTALENGDQALSLDVLWMIFKQNPLYRPARIWLAERLLRDANLKQAREILEETNSLFQNSMEIQQLISDLQNREAILESSRKRLQSFKDIHKSKRCVIIGNGPSLNKMDLSFLKHEICFGMNRIYLGFEKWGFTPNYYVSVNKLVLEQSAEEISKIPCPKFLSSKGITYFSQQDDIFFVDTVNFQQAFSPTPLKGLNEGYTVTYFALQLAYYMGFETVVLIGVDHSFTTKGKANKEITSPGDDPNHFHPGYFGKGTRWQLPDLENSEKHYRLAEAHFRSDGRQIIDATVGGKCPVFPKADYRQFFADTLTLKNPHLFQSSNQVKSQLKISLFTTTKPFLGDASILQINAIKSWKFICPEVEVLVFGNEEGVARICQELNIKHIPNVKYNEFGTPLLSDIFEKAQALASNDIVVYINADIILLSDFIPAIQKIDERFPQFLAVGQRWDLNIETNLNFDDKSWEEKLRQMVHKEGKLHPEYGIDYFVFKKGTFLDFPDFAVGRPTWDNFTIYTMLADSCPVIDLTEEVTVIHQNHDYSHIRMGKLAHYKGVETDRNRALAIDCLALSRVNTIYAHIGYTNNATWKLTKQGIIRTVNADKIEQVCRYLKENGCELVRQIYGLVQRYKDNPKDSELQNKVQSTHSELTRFFLHLALEDIEKYNLISLSQAYLSLLDSVGFYGTGNSKNVMYEQAQVYLRFAKIHIVNGSLKDASKICAEAIKLQPDSAELYQVFSEVLQQQNRVKPAEQARRKANQLRCIQV